MITKLYFRFASTIMRLDFFDTVSAEKELGPWANGVDRIVITLNFSKSIEQKCTFNKIKMKIQLLIHFILTIINGFKPLCNVYGLISYS